MEAKLALNGAPGVGTWGLGIWNCGAAGDGMGLLGQGSVLTLGAKIESSLGFRV